MILDASSTKASQRFAFMGHIHLHTTENISFQFKFFPEFANRITWGVSTFHAFAHEAPCQVLYHPQKRASFGHTDGEGCERVWASLQKLIAPLRVSGVRQAFHPSMGKQMLIKLPCSITKDFIY
jgi:hypothetical protein